MRTQIMKVPLENVKCMRLGENFYIEKVRFKNGCWIGKSENYAKQIGRKVITWAFFNSANKLLVEIGSKDFNKKFKQFRNKNGEWSWVR